MLWLLLFVGLLGARPSQGQVYFANLTAPFENFTPSCISVLNQAVDCDPKLLDAGRNGRFESDETLASVCTTACTNALTTWARRVAGACVAGRYPIHNGRGTVLASFLGQSTLERYYTLCVKSPEGKFCNAVLQSALSARATATAGAPGFECHTCAASIISTQLQMPIGAGNVHMQTEYESLTSSCSIASMSVTPLATTTTWVTIDEPTAAPGCSGTKYTIQAGDNCYSIALKQGISTISLLTANNLKAFCANFPTSGTLCIPSAKVCKPYQLKADLSDTCASVAQAQGVRWVQMVSWNPEVGEYCENMARLAKTGHVICASTPGGGWVNPFPEVPEPTTTEPETYFTLPPTEFASAPSPTWDPPYPLAGFMDPIANGSVRDCHLYRAPPVQVNETSSEDSYRCSDFARFYGITVEQLVEVNPSLAARLADGDCDLWAGEQYCAQRDLSQASDMTQYCADTRVAESGPRSTCDGFVNWYGLERAAFLAWNPSLGGECEGFHTGHTYCTSVHRFRPAGTISTCSRWHMATDVDAANDPCGTIETRYGLVHARFVAWNPTVKSDCSGIRLHYDYCVGTPSFPGTGA